MSNTQKTTSTPQIKKGCNNYEWDPKSAIKKLTSNMTVSANIGGISAVKTFEQYNPQKDSYNNCKNCGTHKNYHIQKKDYSSDSDDE